MSDFCKQCALAIFGESAYVDGDLAGITSKEDWDEGKAAEVLCEGCGAIQVDPEGNCLGGCSENHTYDPEGNAESNQCALHEEEEK